MTKVEDLKKRILEEIPSLLPHVADMLAQAWIANPEIIKELMKEDVRNERKGKKKEVPEVQLSYDCITVNEN